MKRMKKILVGFLAALTVFCSSFGLAACSLWTGGGNQSSSDKDSSSVSSEEESSSSSSQGGGNTDDSSNSSNSSNSSGGSSTDGDGTLDSDPVNEYDDIISDGDLRG